MAEKIYNVVPCPDTVIILRSPLKNFAPWEQADESANNSVEPLGEEPAPVDHRDSSPQAQASLFGGGDTESVKETSAGQPENTAATASSPIDNGHPQTKELPVGGVHYHCSGAHLKLASKTFEKALSGDWAESVRHTDGRYYIVVEDWDEVALLTLLNAIHLRNGKVPRGLDVEELAKIATLVDYYQCHEAVAFCAKMWTSHLLNTYDMPREYSRDLMLWLCVACVFKLSPVFESTTMTAIKAGTDGSLRTLSLPIPQSVSARIEEKRIMLISTTLADMYALLDSYRDLHYICPVEKDHSSLCGSVMFGALTKELDKLGLLPRPSEPYHGMCLQNLWGDIDHIGQVRWRTFDAPKSSSQSGIFGSSPPAPKSSDAAHACNLKDRVCILLDSHVCYSCLTFRDCGLGESESKEEDGTGHRFNSAASMAQAKQLMSGGLDDICTENTENPRPKRCSKVDQLRTS